MLTESVADPRRANWLTISSMTEDLCWPEESSTARPNWELEAEILRLTTRLMMQEQELRRVKNQLKSQTSKNQQQGLSWRRRMEEKEEQMKELLVQKDAEMQNIVSQLMLFEAELRREQVRIEDLLCEKDAQLLSQQKEIKRLKRSLNFPTNNNDINFSTPNNDFEGNNLDQGASCERLKSPVDSKTNCDSMLIADLDPIAYMRRSMDSKANSNSSESSIVIDSTKHCIDRKSSSSSPSFDNFALMESSEHLVNTKTNSVIPNGLSSKECSKQFMEGRNNSDRRSNSSSLASDFVPNFRHSIDTRTSRSNNNTLNMKANDLLSSSFCNGGNECAKFNRSLNARIFEDESYGTQHAVQKLKDGLVKIRAIQDVTNVKSLDMTNNDVVIERKRIQYKSPQKMKDLKAKRINPHRMHRPVIPEMTAQALL